MQAGESGERCVPYLILRLSLWAGEKKQLATLCVMEACLSTSSPGSDSREGDEKGHNLKGNLHYKLWENREKNTF